MFNGKIRAMQLKLALAQIARNWGTCNLIWKSTWTISTGQIPKADLILFPNIINRILSPGLGSDCGHRPLENDPIFHPLFEASKDIDLVVGFVDEDYRHRFYIASAFFQAVACSMFIISFYLPPMPCLTRDVSLPRDSLRAFDTRFGRVWHAHLRSFLACLAALSSLAGWGPTCCLFSSASPGRRLECA